MKKLLFALLLVCGSAFAEDAPTPGPESTPILYTMRAEVLRVVDGDTIIVRLSLMYDLTKENVQVRMLGVDTPETRTKDPAEKAAGLAAKAFVEGLLPVGARIRVIVRENGQVDNFGRTLAWVILPDGTNLSTLLLEKGLAKVYAGD